MKTEKIDLGFTIDDMEINLDDFNIDFETDFDTEHRYNKPKVFKSMFSQMVKYSNAKKLAADLSLEKDTQTHVIVSGNFIMGDLIEAIITKRMKRVDDLTISTLSLSLDNIASLAILVKGNFVSELNLIVSDYFYSHERRNLINAIYERLDIGNKFQLGVFRLHTKVYQFKFDDMYVTMYGSSNMRSSHNVEQLVIDTSKECYDFYKEFHNDIMNKNSLINKEINKK